MAKLLEENIVLLTETLANITPILNRLQGRKDPIITLHDIDVINSKPTPLDKNTELVHLMMKKSEEDIFSFLDILRSVGYQSIVNKIVVPVPADKIGFDGRSQFNNARITSTSTPPTLETCSRVEFGGGNFYPGSGQGLDILSPWSGFHLTERIETDHYTAHCNPQNQFSLGFPLPNSSNSLSQRVREPSHLEQTLSAHSNHWNLSLRSRPRPSVAIYQSPVATTDIYQSPVITADQYQSAVTTADQYQSPVTTAALTQQPPERENPYLQPYIGLIVCPYESLTSESENVLNPTLTDSDSFTNYCNLLGLKDILDCEESIPRDQIVSHVKQHGLNGVNGNKADVIQELEDFTNPRSWFPVYFEAYDEIFFLLSSTQNDCCPDSSLLISLKCVMVGNPLSAKNFCYQFCLTNSDKGSRSLRQFNCPVIGIENHENSADSQFSVPLSQCKQFKKCDGTNKLEWTINVQISKKSNNTIGVQKLENISIPTVKTCSFGLKTVVTKKSNSILTLIGNSVSGNAKVFMDLAYGTKLIGRLVIELRNDVVPLTAENFRCLCTGEKGFGYKGTCFYYIDVQNFMRGGDVTKDDGTGGKSIYGDTFKKENCSLMHNERGILSMANRGRNINGSVFTITLGERSGWDGRYVVFGKVVEGMKVLDDLEKIILSFNGRIAENKKTSIQNCGQL